MNEPPTPVNPDGKRAPLIFAVDDEPMITTVVEAILEPEGYQLCIFQDPAQLLKAIQDANPKPDLVLTDFVMGDMNGMELIAGCRRVAPGLKTILISGTVSENLVRTFPSQPDRFLAKPFQAEALLATVREVLRG